MSRRRCTSIARDSIYKAFSAQPCAAFTVVKGGLEEIDLRDVLGLLERDVRFITDMVGWQLSTPGVLETYLDYDGNIT